MSTYRQFAERILFSSSLEEKLAAPTQSLVDDAMGPPILSPLVPARSRELRFAAIGEHGPKPREDRLTEDRERGLLLHFFCNHELLATELMALALLKFPDAPAPFRKGLMHTLQEEQQHTQWYLKRMAECGVSFGEYPVNGFFWRSIADMTTPMDYVARLSLTFEQANLDYAQHYAARFHEAGDEVTAALLQQIYKDEIAHVGYGLKWFRRWKGEHRSDWQAFQELLAFPLSPARAKGTRHFNAAGRRKAGLDDVFIAALELYSQSRGRTPWVYVFNPGAEAAAAAQDPNAIDPSTRQITQDLDTLPFFLANAEDTVLLQREPRADFLRDLKSLGVELPAQEILVEGKLAAGSELRNRKLGKLRPWGWSSDSHELLRDLLPNLPASDQVSPWSQGTRKLYTKAHAAECLARLPWQAAFGSREIIGSPEGSMEAIWGAGHTAVVKANFGIAGRSMARFAPEDKLTALEPLRQSPGGYVVEPWLERVADFSAQYECEPDQPPRLKGLVRLHCEPSGRFTACVASGTFSRLLPAEVARFLNEQGSPWLKQLYGTEIPNVLAASLAGTGFRGFLGIDAFFYRDAGGNLRLKPIVEINPRCTMGRTTWELMGLAAPGHTVLMRIFSKAALKKAGHATFPAAAAALQLRYPRQFNASGQLHGGVFTLNDPATATGFLAVALVSKRAIGPESLTLI